MKVFLAAVLFVGLCVLGLGVNIFFRKGGKFPQTDISSNEEMRKRGIKCPRMEEMALHGDALGRRPRHDNTTVSCHSERSERISCDGHFSDACRDCALFKFEK